MWVMTETGRDNQRRVASNQGYTLSANVNHYGATLAQGHPPTPATVSASIGPHPWWPLHPVAVQASHCKTQQLATAPAPFPPIPQQLPQWTFQQAQTPTVVAPYQPTSRPTPQWTQPWASAHTSREHQQCQCCKGAGHAAGSCAMGRPCNQPCYYCCSQRGHLQANCPGNRWT
ncbi:hypothetical protein IscW_ISCW018374 [Ixodes scapularis]|uniref:CCHC-type domain-containing protein n=1 Tax=Ixodes scapularis TaxID=6945 RepID=B7PK46_IXOSC|nr:hypothetical protein IscW_ISCW018374 [Ixodes scapularis]|eukprot:XP_002409284.1 hypothetical protein IscW_ISCW018374 [Ixodes scapularis]